MRNFFVHIVLLLGAIPIFAQRLEERHFRNYIDLCQAVFGITYSPQELARIRQDVEGYWKSGDRESINTVIQSAQKWDEVQSRPRDLALTAWRMTLPGTLRAVHDAADRGRADSQYLLDVYYQRNPILAPRKPGGVPLTRSMVEADLAMKHWLANEIHHQNAPAPDAQVLAAATRTAVHAWPSLTSQQQMKFAEQMAEWARVSYAWPRASAIDKLITRSDMGARLTPQEQAAIQQVMAGFNAQLNGLRQQQMGMLQSTIDHMKQTSETIMGRGTVWNPASGRWEQQGGVVTEYNGVVRVP